MTSPILVLGATGKTGRRVAERLSARGIPVRPGSRTAEPPFDWDDRATWAGALHGASAAYISFYPDIAVPGAPETIAEFSAQAVGAGVRRLVLLSGRGEPEARKAEQELARSGAEWTVLRCSWFDQNFSEAHFRAPLLEGELALPADGVPEPFVDADDIADVAVAALAGPGHAGEIYELTGPRLLTFADAVAEIGAATGRELRFRPIPLDAFDDPLLRVLFGEVLDGRNAHVADGVQRALGREARDFADFARAAAAAGAWAP